MDEHPTRAAVGPAAAAAVGSAPGAAVPVPEVVIVATGETGHQEEGAMGVGKKRQAFSVSSGRPT